jgi:hypothetical protein
MEDLMDTMVDTITRMNCGHDRGVARPHAGLAQLELEVRAAKQAHHHHVTVELINISSAAGHGPWSESDSENYTTQRPEHDSVGSQRQPECSATRRVAPGPFKLSSRYSNPNSLSTPGPHCPGLDPGTNEQRDTWPWPAKEKPTPSAAQPKRLRSWVTIQVQTATLAMMFSQLRATASAQQSGPNLKATG